MASDSSAVYAGFDLGTTNSAAAVFDGEQLSLVRNTHGAPLTPSVVHIDGKGRVTVGARALRHLDGDPDNTHSEFKRLMGTEESLDFPGAGIAKTPQQLAAEILSSLRQDMADQLGFAPDSAVISVPALFELPQNSATSEAARLAGFERVELIQEPIASALAAGWTEQEAGGTWLVYDLGGGTFDVSLLETRDGLLRVVGHDGDNFLGGRDFDNALVNWAIETLANTAGATLNRSNPEHTVAIRALRRAAEETKIELSRRHDAALTTAEPLDVDRFSIEVDLEVTRDLLEQTCAPIVDRTLEICRRLMNTHGLREDQLARVVLVGGPTVMPYVRRRVGEGLGTTVADGYDPMTLVAQGAALYAATSGLDATPRTTAPEPTGHRLWLQYPAVSSDLTPHVLGRLVGEGPGNPPAKIRLRRSAMTGADEWISPDAPIDDEGAFVVMADLVARKPNEFAIEAFDADGKPVVVAPASFSIVQGLTITDPPLSRSIGVALANDSVRVYFERGQPLPARRTFMHHTVESVAKGSADSVLKIPLVQGEFDQAHLCRHIGTLEISGGLVADTVPAGSHVEVTLELDRGGRLSAEALIPAVEQSFDEVAHLLVPDAVPEILLSTVATMKSRVEAMRTEAFRQGATRVIERLADAETRLGDIVGDIEAARGGDADAGQKARRSLLELDAVLDEVDLESRWPELEDKARSDMTFATEWVARYGSGSERQLLDEVGEGVNRARASKNVGELQRQLRLARRLGTAAFYRHPEAWEWMFESAASEMSSASNLPEAEQLVRQGRAAIERGDTDGIRRATEGLWKLLPADAKHRRLSFDSGVQ